MVSRPESDRGSARRRLIMTVGSGQLGGTAPGVCHTLAPPSAPPTVRHAPTSRPWRRRRTAVDEPRDQRVRDAIPALLATFATATVATSFTEDDPHCPRRRLSNKPPRQVWVAPDPHCRRPFGAQRFAVACHRKCWQSVSIAQASQTGNKALLVSMSKPTSVGNVRSSFGAPAQNEAEFAWSNIYMAR